MHSISVRLATHQGYRAVVEHVLMCCSLRDQHLCAEFGQTGPRAEAQTAQCALHLRQQHSTTTLVPHL